MNGLKEQPVAEVIPAQEDGPALGDTSEPEEEALRRRRVKGKGHERAVEDSDKEHPSMSTSPSEVSSPTLVPAAATQDLVGKYVQVWQELNEWTTDIGFDELYLRCLHSESLVWKAFTDLSPLQLSEFRARLGALGYEAQDAAFHYQQASYFAQHLSKEASKFDLTAEERARASENVSSPQQNPDLDTNIIGKPLEPRLEVYRVRKLNECVCDADVKLATRLQALFKASDKRPLSEDEATQIQNIFDYVTPTGSPTTHEPQDQIDSGSPQSESRSSNTNHSTGNQDRATQLQERVNAAKKELEEELAKLEAALSAPRPPPEGNRMAISTEVALPLPVLPQGWTAEKEFKAADTVSEATQRSIEPVGPHFLAHARRARHKRTFSEDDRIQAQENVKKVEDDDPGEISEPEDPAMLMRDAKDWKGQDHYAVLGLSKYRWKATEEQIKRAHRKKVLRHHPDKKAAAGSTEDDNFFKCIQKATEILLDPVKRRQFDSVDEAADYEPPTKKQVQKGNFYKLWGPVFKSEARFSRIQPVPKLGDENSTKEEVENFYNFWYNFDSWRSFEYQDEDVPDDNENRDQKRHMERKNNNARKKKKTEDSARLRKLLDECSSMDERIKKFRQEANASKNKKRLEKEAAEKKAAEEAKAKKEAEEKAIRDAEAASKAEREQEKKAKEAAKNAVKKNKRVLKGSVKDANYFVKGDPPAATIDAVLNDVEVVQGKVDADEMASLAAKLAGLKVADEIKAIWSNEVKRLVEAGKLKDGDVKTLVV